MAPSIPEEIDVFMRPHSRMKELVNNFTQKMVHADLSNLSTLLSLLADLHSTLLEFRRHEAIENVLILDRLKLRIRQHHKQPPAQLGHCHDDDSLPKLFEFVRWCERVLGGRGCIAGEVDGSTGSSCLEVGGQLHSAYTHFLQHFLPHMKQEEQEFQPLLMNHFEYNELKALKDEVWRQHQLYTEQQPSQQDTVRQFSVTKLAKAMSQTKLQMLTEHSYNGSVTELETTLDNAKSRTNKTGAGDATKHRQRSSASMSSITVLSSNLPVLVIPPLTIRTKVNSGSSSLDSTDCHSSQSNVHSELSAPASDAKSSFACIKKGKISKSSSFCSSSSKQFNSLNSSDQPASSSPTKVVSERSTSCYCTAISGRVNVKEVEKPVFTAELTRTIAFESCDQNSITAPQNTSFSSFKPQLIRESVNTSHNQSPYSETANNRVKSLTDRTKTSTARDATQRRNGNFAVSLNCINDDFEVHPINHITRSHTFPLSVNARNVQLMKHSKEDFNKRRLYFNNDQHGNNVVARKLTESNAVSNDMNTLSSNIQTNLDHNIDLRQKEEANSFVQENKRISSSSGSSSVSSSCSDVSSTENVKLDTCMWGQDNISLTVTTLTTSLLVLPHEVLLCILRYLSPQDLIRLASVSQALNVIAYDKSLWRKLYPTQWSKGLWGWSNLHLGNALEDDSINSTASYDAALDEDADSDTSLPPTIVSRHRAVMEGLLAGVCRRVGNTVHSLVLDGAVSVCSRSLNKMLALCPNLTKLSAAYCSVDYLAFKGLWQHGSLRRLQELDLQGCDKIDDAALNCLALCASHGDSSSVGEESAVCCGDSATKKSSSKHQYDNYKRWLGAGSAESCEDCSTAVQSDDASNDESCNEDPNPTEKNNNCNLNDSTRWNYQPTTNETVRMTSYLSSVIHTNFSLTKSTNIKQSACCSGKTKSVSLPKYNRAALMLHTLNLSGCRSVSCTGLELLIESGILRNLRIVDLSGCDLLTNACITKLLVSCRLLAYDQVAYCDNVEDVPGERESGGCDNLAHPLRYCCRRGD